MQEIDEEEEEEEEVVWEAALDEEIMMGDEDFLVSSKSQSTSTVCSWITNEIEEKPRFKTMRQLRYTVPADIENQMNIGGRHDDIGTNEKVETRSWVESEGCVFKGGHLPLRARPAHEHHRVQVRGRISLLSRASAKNAPGKREGRYFITPSRPVVKDFPKRLPRKKRMKKPRYEKETELRQIALWNSWREKWRRQV
ncbi:uncharacterized protein [Diadema setosum]|uniref:uncharacterized protein isoform X1 n=1 Tax=Diadema setosum TaxID=31175 RepID=UPI003B3B10C6